MCSGGGTNTTTTSNAPPQQFLDQYTAVNQAAQQAASVPYQNYTGQTVAQLSPDQTTAFGQVENLTANGGIQQPYLTAANNAYTQAAEGIDPANFATTEAAYQSPYTQQVLNATEQSEMNTDAQQQQQMAGNAVSAGAWGGDRSAVLQGITAGQQALANNTTNAGIEQAGFNQATSTAEANQWLNSQAGAGEANLGSEEQALGLSGASALLQSGGLEQQQAQENLNVPFEQWTAQQAYPFQTQGWLANIAEGLGGASGGTSSTTSPGASVGSQIAGLGVAGIGVAGATGAFRGAGTPSVVNDSGSIAGGGTGYAPGYSAGIGGAAAGGAITRIHNLSGGLVPRRAPGGGIPDVDLSIVPGSDGLGAIPATHGTPDILKNYGETSTTTGGPSELGQLIGLGGQIAATVYGSPLAGAAAGAFNQAVGLREGGMVPHRDIGGGTGMQFKSVTPSLTGQLPKPPDVSAAIVPTPQSTHGGMGIPRAPQAVTPPTLGSAVQGAAAALKGMNLNKTTMRTGGMVQRFDTGGGTSSADQPAPWYTPLLQEQLDSQMMQSLGLTSVDTGMASGGMIHRQHFDIGGMSIGEADPSWARTAEAQSVERHGLLSSPIAGRTDKLAISPISGSYIVPADVISGLGEGNTLAGANVMQRILETGPHGLRMPNAPHKEMGIPRPPPAYREGMMDNGASAGGMVLRRDDGGSVDDEGEDNVTYDYNVDSSPAETSWHPDTTAPLPWTPADGGTTTTTVKPNITPSDTNTSRFHTAQADPWLALAEAGFGMAAGKSPHALENIGSGAEQGVKTYIQEKQQANQQNLTAQELQARLADTAAYRQGLLGVRGTTADASKIRADAYAAFTQRKAELRSQGLDEKTANDQAMQDWRQGTLGVQQKNADTNAARETDTATNNAARTSLSTQSLALRQQALEATIKQRGIQNDAAAQKEAARQLGQMTDQQIRAMNAGRNTMTGVAPTPQQAGQAVDTMRGHSKATLAPNTPPPATAPQIPSWVKPGDQYSPSQGKARDVNGNIYGAP